MPSSKEICAVIRYCVIFKVFTFCKISINLSDKHGKDKCQPQFSVVRNKLDWSKKKTLKRQPLFGPRYKCNS